MAVIINPIKLERPNIKSKLFNLIAPLTYNSHYSILILLNTGTDNKSII